MKTARWGMGFLGLLLLWGCGGSRSATVQNDTYLTAKERAKVNQEAQASAKPEGVDAREDNYEETRSSRWRADDEDYCYSCRVRRYSTGVWYDPWMDPCWGWRRSAWWGPSWYAWGPTWGWSYAWGYPAGWYYSYGWSPSWGYYADPYWSYYYGGYPVGGSTSSYRSNYRPRTYTAPSGGTVYTPPRGTIQSSSPTPPRRTNALPSYSRPGAGGSTIPSGGTYSPSGGRPSMSGGGTGGGIRSSGSGGVRPR